MAEWLTVRRATLIGLLAAYLWFAGYGEAVVAAVAVVALAYIGWQVIRGARYLAVSTFRRIRAVK